jgi:hypothetical protein
MFRVKDSLAAEITDVTMDAGTVLVVPAFAHHVEWAELRFGVGD